MRKPKPKENIKPFNDFHCLTCHEILKGEKAFKAHLKDVHGISEAKGTVQTRAHIDEQGWYADILDLTIGGLVFRQSTITLKD